jgi:hypothetical protein
VKFHWGSGILGSLLALGGALSCSGDHAAEWTESIGSSSEALSAAQTRVLGFESVAGAGGDWAASNAKLQSGTQHIEGAKSAEFGVDSDTNFSSC